MEFLRVSKYDSKFRTENGKYIKTEWTSYGDIGKKFEDKILRLPDYELVEQRYIDTVLEIAKKLGVNSFLLTQLEESSNTYSLTKHNELKKLYDNLKENKQIQIDDLPLVMRLLLREFIWGKLIHEQLIIHFGYDYYIYIGVNKENVENLKKIIKRHALFYEEQSISPYD